MVYGIWCTVSCVVMCFLFFCIFCSVLFFLILICENAQYLLLVADILTFTSDSEDYFIFEFSTFSFGQNLGKHVLFFTPHHTFHSSGNHHRRDLVSANSSLVRA